MTRRRRRVVEARLGYRAWVVGLPRLGCLGCVEARLGYRCVQSEKETAARRWPCLPLGNTASDRRRRAGGLIYGVGTCRLLSLCLCSTACSPIRVIRVI